MSEPELAAENALLRAEVERLHAVEASARLVAECSKCCASKCPAILALLHDLAVSQA